MVPCGRLFFLLFRVLTLHTFVQGVCAGIGAVYIYAVSRRGVRRHVRRIFSLFGLPIPDSPPFLTVSYKGGLKTLCFKRPFYETIRNGPDPTFVIVLHKGCLKTLYFKWSFYKTILKWSRSTSMGVPKCPGKQFGVCARCAPSTFGEPFLGALFGNLLWFVFALNLICFVMISIGYALVLWKEQLLTHGCAPG